MRVVVGFTSLICGLKRASLVTPMRWVVATAPRYFIHTAEFFTVYLRRGTCDLRLEKQPGSLPFRCRRRRRRRRRVYSVGEA